MPCLRPFDNVCPDMDYLKRTPLEHVPLGHTTDPRDLFLFRVIE